METTSSSSPPLNFDPGSLNIDLFIPELSRLKNENNEIKRNLQNVQAELAETKGILQNVQWELANQKIWRESLEHILSMNGIDTRRVVPIHHRNMNLASHSTATTETQARSREKEDNAKVNFFHDQNRFLMGTNFSTKLDSSRPVITNVESSSQLISNTSASSSLIQESSYESISSPEIVIEQEPSSIIETTNGNGNVNRNEHEMRQNIVRAVCSNNNFSGGSCSRNCSSSSVQSSEKSLQQNNEQNATSSSSSSTSSSTFPPNPREKPSDSVLMHQFIETKVHGAPGLLSEQYKTHYCKLCYFSSRDFLKTLRHVRLEHFEERRFSCEICHQRFFRKCDMNSHITRIHKKPQQDNISIPSACIGESSSSSVVTDQSPSTSQKSYEVVADDLFLKFTGPNVGIPLEDAHKYFKQNEHADSLNMKEYVCSLCRVNSYSEALMVHHVIFHHRPPDSVNDTTQNSLETRNHNNNDHNSNDNSETSRINNNNDGGGDQEIAENGNQIEQNVENIITTNGGHLPPFKKRKHKTSPPLPFNEEMISVLDSHIMTQDEGSAFVCNLCSFRSFISQENARLHVYETHPHAYQGLL